MNTPCALTANLNPVQEKTENNDIMGEFQGPTETILSTLPIKCLHKKQENQARSKARDGMITISRNLRAMRVTWRPNSVR
jgi:hypothetical protein